MRLDAAVMAVYYFGMPVGNLDFMEDNGKPEG
jgi:hypothetical protein